MSITKNTIAQEVANLLRAEETVTDVDTSETLFSLQFRDTFDRILESELVSYPWKWATYRAELAQSAITPAYEYDYKYQLPTSPKFLYLREIVTTSDYTIADYSIEGNFILTDTDTCQIKYIGLPTEYHFMPADFHRALVYYIAAELVTPITGNPAQMSDFIALADRYMVKSKNRDGNSSKQPTLNRDNFSFLTSRRL